MVSVSLDTAAALAAALRRERLLAIVRGQNPEAAFRAIEVLATSGIPLIEVSLTSNDALAVIRRASTALGDAATIGAGTVRTRADAEAAVTAGASFLVTPAVELEAADLDAPAIVGALTPTEITLAMELGPIAIKLFPASLGGPEYLTALRQPFPDIAFLPVGGIDATSAREYLARGALAVGVGGPLLGDAGSGGDLAALAARARMFRRAVAEAET
jgi:2-dehydro-3-deoxyphosphogluconate aldolase / (4S)-4-hydroxy-2-oxoglutarate aldolase